MTTQGSMDRRTFRSQGVSTAGARGGAGLRPRYVPGLPEGSG